tara:strand:+ start:638 stop:1039 length:402 start_codon:yes stop_codon:yes gene_type:complete
MLLNFKTMNLYRITFSHTAPKDSKEGIKGYLLAENDEQVYNYVDKTFNDECWKDNEEDEDREPIELYDDDYNVIGTETFKEKMLRIKGEQNDEDYDYCDAYYGITLYGWELVKENADGDYTEMIELGIISNCI